LDATAWVGIVGIVGTLAAAIFAPIAGEIARRKSVRKERLLERRLAAYADLLTVGVQFVDSTMNLASLPGADFSEPEANELNRLDGQIRLVASKSVRNHFKTFTEQLAKFRAAQFRAEFHHKAIRNSNDSGADDAQAIEQRMELGRMADAIRDTYHELEAAIRDDVQA
jgi:hypothetical protein